MPASGYVHIYRKHNKFQFMNKQENYTKNIIQVDRYV